MGLIVYGYYEKEKAISILNNLKYYKGFEEIKGLESRGLIAYISMYQEKSHEDFLIDKMKIVKSILDKQGDNALDALRELTSPDEKHFMQPMKKMFEKDDWIKEFIDEISIPMKKEEFYHYLDIYNSVYGN